MRDTRDKGAKQDRLRALQTGATKARLLENSKEKINLSKFQAFRLWETKERLKDRRQKNCGNEIKRERSPAGSFSYFRVELKP